jgi:hypothetical protein
VASDALRIALNGLGRACSVRDARGVAQVEDVFTRQSSADGEGNREATDT